MDEGIQAHCYVIIMGLGTLRQLLDFSCQKQGLSSRETQVGIPAWPFNG